jgi:CRISPR/Cas system CMR-associated protein Cmr1 (group 7 of RAMP superfamily)
MDENKFFKFVWRFNGLVLLVAGILAIGVICFAGYGIFQETTRERQVRNIVNVADKTDLDEKWRLGYLKDVDGTPYLMIPLHSDQSYAQSYYSKSSYSTRNYLFINSDTNQKHWLLDTNDYLIMNDEMLSVEKNNAKNRKVRAILYHMVKKDTNGDGRLTHDDLSVVALSKPDGTEFREIFSDLDVFIGHRVIDKNSALLIYQKNGKGYSATLSLKNFELSTATELPKVGHP